MTIEQWAEKHGITATLVASDFRVIFMRQGNPESYSIVAPPDTDSHEAIADLCEQGQATTELDSSAVADLIFRLDGFDGIDFGSPAFVRWVGADAHRELSECDRPC